MYKIEVRHHGLRKSRLIQGSNSYVVQGRANAQLRRWNEAWDRRVAIESRIATKEANQQAALDQTQEAQAAIEALLLILAHTLTVDDAIVWESLKDSSAFPIPPPVEGSKPVTPQEPDSKDGKYCPRKSILDHFFTGRFDRRLEAAQRQYKSDRASWEVACTRMRQMWGFERARVEKRRVEWRRERETFEKAQQEKNAAVDALHERYLRADPAAIEEQADIVLSRSQYPDTFPQSFEFQYVANTRTMLVEYVLPGRQCVPRLKEVKFVQGQDELTQSVLDDRDVDRIYDEVVYQVVLRTMRELFEADVANALDSIIFNGWVRSVHASTGNDGNACIVSIQATRDEVLKINFAQIDPKACFKRLRGIGCAQLHSLTPISPIQSLKREEMERVEPASLTPSSSIQIQPVVARS